MSTGPQFLPTNGSSAPQASERNWLPIVIAAVVVVVVAVVAVIVLERSKPKATVTPISASLDSYSARLPITNLVMSESSNLSGGKVTYIDGHIANIGSRTVTGVSVQVLFRTFAHEVTQNETHALRLIRTRDPYVDLEPVSAAPLAPGASADFRFIFDSVSPDWDGAYPELRIVHTDTK